MSYFFVVILVFLLKFGGTEPRDRGELMSHKPSRVANNVQLAQSHGGAGFRSAGVYVTVQKP